jgi:hypothetical protein
MKITSEELEKGLELLSQRKFIVGKKLRLVEKIKTMINLYGEIDDVIISQSGICKSGNRKFINYIGKLNFDGVSLCSKYLDNGEISYFDMYYENIHEITLTNILSVIYDKHNLKSINNVKA